MFLEIRVKLKFVLILLYLSPGEKCVCVAQTCFTMFSDCFLLLLLLLLLFFVLFCFLFVCMFVCLFASFLLFVCLFVLPK